MHFLGVNLIGATPENAIKLLLTVAALAALVLVRHAFLGLARRVGSGPANERFIFWSRQVSSLAVGVLGALFVVSIWFDNPARLATAFALVTAGLAFALQRVISAFAGYIVIMRGKTFSVGDRVTMGGVRGDVIALGFMQTTILEMGQPPSVASQASPAMWVHGRQFTGRIVNVTNAIIFEEPIYNYTTELPFLWEEISIPISYQDDRCRAEEILISSATMATEEVRTELEKQRQSLEEKYFVALGDLSPRAYYRLTDNWLELTVRFVVRDRAIRAVKDAIARSVLAAFEQAGIRIASATYDVV
ncbi:MAG: mechanosensitive ion channel domain-containing protein, partial [Polyangiaceae bacterium]